MSRVDRTTLPVPVVVSVTSLPAVPAFTAAPTVRFAPAFVSTIDPLVVVAVV